MRYVLLSTPARFTPCWVPKGSTDTWVRYTMMCVTYYDIYSCDAMMFVRYLTHDVTTVIRVAPASVLRCGVQSEARRRGKGVQYCSPVRHGCPLSSSLVSTLLRRPALRSQSRPLMCCSASFFARSTAYASVSSWRHD